MELRLPVILDGSTGTELKRRGMPHGVCTESWILGNPNVMLELQREYVDAGSGVIYAPTFGANRTKLEGHGIFNRVEEYNKRLVAISKEAAGKKALVAGDISPAGLFLYPLGDATFDELVEIYTEQAAALESAGADLFVIETMIGIPEARAALTAVKSVSRKPVFVTFSCDESGRTITGTDILAALVIMQGMGADAFGLNCSSGPDAMLPIIKRLSGYAQIPLIAKPNAGLPKVRDGRTVYDCEPQEFAQSMVELAKQGVLILGGCCGSTPEHIKRLADELSAIQPSRKYGSYGELLPAATEKQAVFLPVDAEHGSIIPCDDELEDALCEEEESDAPMTALLLEDAAGLDSLMDCQYMLKKPLCLYCEDAGLLEKALRIYQGRAVYAGELEDKDLMPLVRRYGLII